MSRTIAALGFSHGVVLAGILVDASDEVYAADVGSKT